MTLFNRKHAVDYGFMPSLINNEDFQFAPYIHKCETFSLFPVEDQTKYCNCYEFSPKPSLRIVFDIPQSQLNRYFYDKLGEKEPYGEYHTLNSSVYRSMLISKLNKTPVLSFECGPGECDSLFLIPTLSDFKKAIKYLQKDCQCCGSVKESDIKYREVGFIYILKAVEQPNFGYKIGKTKTPFSRCNFLSVKLPFDVAVLRNYIVPSKEMSLIESRLHQVFRHRHLNGEWFSLTLTDFYAIEDMLLRPGGYLNAIDEIADKMSDENFKNLLMERGIIRKNLFKALMAFEDNERKYRGNDPLCQAGIRRALQDFWW